MKRLTLLLTVIIITISTFSCGKIKSQGESLLPIIKGKKKTIGKTYSLTLSYINLERDDSGVYLRLFDKNYKTIFVYFDKSIGNKILNLTKNKKYIFKFKITKNDRFSTLSGKLIEVANLKSEKIKNTRENDKPSLNLIRIIGKEAVNKTYTLNLKFKVKTKKPDGTQYLVFDNDFGISLNLLYPETLKEKINELQDAQKYKIKFKITENVRDIWGELISIE